MKYHNFCLVQSGLSEDKHGPTLPLSPVSRSHSNQGPLTRLESRTWFMRDFARHTLKAKFEEVTEFYILKQFERLSRSINVM